jgi:hypothetical protein
MAYWCTALPQRCSSSAVDCAACNSAACTSSRSGASPAQPQYRPSAFTFCVCTGHLCAAPRHVACALRLCGLPWVISGCSATTRCQSARICGYPSPPLGVRPWQMRLCCVFSGLARTRCFSTSYAGTALPRDSEAALSGAADHVQGRGFSLPLLALDWMLSAGPCCRGQEARVVSRVQLPSGPGVLCSIADTCGGAKRSSSGRRPTSSPIHPAPARGVACAKLVLLDMLCLCVAIASVRMQTKSQCRVAAQAVRLCTAVGTTARTRRMRLPVTATRSPRCFLWTARTPSYFL